MGVGVWGRLLLSQCEKRPHVVHELVEVVGKGGLRAVDGLDTKLEVLALLAQGLVVIGHFGYCPVEPGHGGVERHLFGLKV